VLAVEPLGRRLGTAALVPWKPRLAILAEDVLVADFTTQGQRVEDGLHLEVATFKELATFTGTNLLVMRKMVNLANIAIVDALAIFERQLPGPPTEAQLPGPYVDVLLGPSQRFL
jgi:hypothetical protein